MGELASDALQSADEQCADGPAEWNQHEIPGGKHHRQRPQATGKHGWVSQSCCFQSLYMHTHKMNTGNNEDITLMRLVYIFCNTKCKIW